MVLETPKKLINDEIMVIAIYCVIELVNFYRYILYNVLSPELYHLQDLRTLRAKHHPTQVTEKIKYKPAMGRDTNSGPLVETKVGEGRGRGGEGGERIMSGRDKRGGGVFKGRIERVEKSI